MKTTSSRALTTTMVRSPRIPTHQHSHTRSFSSSHLNSPLGQYPENSRCTLCHSSKMLIHCFSWTTRYRVIPWPKSRQFAPCHEYSSSSISRFPSPIPPAPQHPDAVEDRHRHVGIQMHPKSIGQLILPGNVVMKANRRTGVAKPRYTELVYGYFWPLKELQQCEDKPILTTEPGHLIPERLARPFPSLPDLQPLGELPTSTPLLDQPTKSQLILPNHFLRRNRSLDVAAQCTLVTVAFRDYGHQLLSSWLVPFRNAFHPRHLQRTQVYQIVVSDGFINRFLLRRLIHQAQAKNTPTEHHPYTLLSFGDDAVALEHWRDSLRLHNPLTGYLFLLDGWGRVRWVASGGATNEEEVQNLLTATRMLVPTLSGTRHSYGMRRRRPKKT